MSIAVSPPVFLLFPKLCVLCLSFLVVYQAAFTSSSPGTTIVIRPSFNYYAYSNHLGASLTYVLTTASPLQPNLNQQKLTLVIHIPVSTPLSLHCINTGPFLTPWH